MFARFPGQSRLGRASVVKGSALAIAAHEKAGQVSLLGILRDSQL